MLDSCMEADLVEKGVQQALYPSKVVRTKNSESLFVFTDRIQCYTKMVLYCYTTGYLVGVVKIGYTSCGSACLVDHVQLMH